MEELRGGVTVEESCGKEESANISTTPRGSSAEGVFRDLPLLDAVVLESNRHDPTHIVPQHVLRTFSTKISLNLSMCASARPLWVQDLLASLEQNEYDLIAWWHLFSCNTQKHSEVFTLSFRLCRIVTTTGCPLLSEWFSARRKRLWSTTAFLSPREI